MLKVFLCSIVLLQVLPQCLSVEKKPPLVEIEEGILKGKYMTTKKGREFSAFLGIPYAQPPIGELRFAPPVPAEKWEGIKDATEFHAVCPQRDIYRRVHLFEGEEDCLFLNVYTPKLNMSDTKPLPVMFWIHGGGWLCGSGNTLWYGPNILLDKDIVLVVPNYRLGFLGFMTTGDLTVPGNNGLKDQLLALKWIKRNIHKFGGDPNRVTIFGESAGGASAHYHLLSPASKGLIHGAISQSGTALNNWALSPNGQNHKNSLKMANLFNCPTECSTKMIECLRNIKDPLEFVRKDVEFMDWDFDPMIPFKPVLEPPHENAFMTEHPVDIMRSGRAEKLPWITGLNSEDGALRVAGLYGNPHLIEDLNTDFKRLMPMSLEYDLTAVNVDYVTTEIRKFYFNNKKIDNSSIESMVNLYTDAWFLSGADDSVRLHRAHVHSPVYYYLFAYRGPASFTSIFGDPHNDYGVCHADELQYLFPVGDELWPHKKPTDNCKQLTDILTTLWYNFAATGNPTPELDDLITSYWKPVKTKALEYLHIGGVDNIKMDKNLYHVRAKFWRHLPTYYRKHIIKDEL